jgi:hypothetical protein
VPDCQSTQCGPDRPLLRLRRNSPSAASGSDCRKEGSMNTKINILYARLSREDMDSNGESGSITKSD